MPVYRGPDGKIIEERTRRVRDDEITNVKAVGDDDVTQMVANSGALEVGNTSGLDADKTHIAGFKAQPNPADGASNAMSNPTVAWLAVVSGPGKGEILTLGYGANSIGRGGGDRVNLDFGDLQISRQEHATITYDPRGRKFYLQHGRGNNLTYLEQEPVLTPTQLTRNAQITLGDTILLFIPLCSADFDWQDIERESPDEPT